MWSRSVHEIFNDISRPPQRVSKHTIYVFKYRLASSVASLNASNLDILNHVSSITNQVHNYICTIFNTPRYCAEVQCEVLVRDQVLPFEQRLRSMRSRVAHQDQGLQQAQERILRVKAESGPASECDGEHHLHHELAQKHSRQLETDHERGRRE